MPSGKIFLTKVFWEKFSEYFFNEKHLLRKFFKKGIFSSSISLKNEKEFFLLSNIKHRAYSSLAINEKEIFEIQIKLL